jgi:hypothetical protein
MLKNKKILLTAILLAIVMGFSRAPSITYACSTASPACGVGGGTTPTPAATTPTPAAQIPSKSDDCSSGNSANCCTETNCDLVTEYVNPTIDFLAAGVGIVVVVMMVIGGIQYITSQDDPQKVSQAKSRITNALFALLLFALMYSLLEWLVPGGIF